MVFNPKSNKPAPGTITSVELADDAVTAGKISDGAVVMPDSAVANDFDVTGTTETRIVEYEFFKDAANKRNLKKIRCYLNLKTSNVSHAATAKLYLNNSAGFDGSDEYVSGSADASVSSSSLTMENLSMEISTAVKNLADGLHTITLSLVSADAAETASSTAQDFDFSTSN